MVWSCRVPESVTETKIFKSRRTVQCKEINVYSITVQILLLCIRTRRCPKYSMMLHALGMVRGRAKKMKRLKGLSNEDLMETNIKEAAET